MAGERERTHDREHERITDFDETHKHPRQPVESGQARQATGQNMSGHDHERRSEETVTAGYDDDDVIPLGPGISDPDNPGGA
jgi:hypothetical protein